MKAETPNPPKNRGDNHLSAQADRADDPARQVEPVYPEWDEERRDYAPEGDAPKSADGGDSG